MVTKIPFLPQLSCPGSFPRFMRSSVLSLHFGLSPVRSIHLLIVERPRPWNVSGSLFFSMLKIARVLQWGPPDVTLAVSIWVKRNGENQLWYFFFDTLCFWFLPWGFFRFSINFRLRACAGRLSLDCPRAGPEDRGPRAGLDQPYGSGGPGQKLADRPYR